MKPPGTYRLRRKTRLKENASAGSKRSNRHFLKLATFKMSCVAAYSPVYRLTLADGKTLECTINHRLYTSEGGSAWAYVS